MRATNTRTPLQSVTSKGIDYQYLLVVVETLATPIPYWHGCLYLVGR